MTTTKWNKGRAEGFWMEDNIPSGEHDNYIFDCTDEWFTGELQSLLSLLSRLKIVQYGTIYEQIECIRIKVK